MPIKALPMKNRPIEVEHVSAISGSHTAVLPEKGLIVFGGEAGDVFKITLERKE